MDSGTLLALRELSTSAAGQPALYSGGDCCCTFAVDGIPDTGCARDYEVYTVAGRSLYLNAGYCYLAMYPWDEWLVLSEELGSWPTVEALLSRDRVGYIGLRKLGAYALGDKGYHLRPFLPHDISAESMFSEIASLRSWPLTSLGHFLAAGYRGTRGEESGQLSDRVGGLIVPPCSPVDFYDGGVIPSSVVEHYYTAYAAYAQACVQVATVSEVSVGSESVSSTPQSSAISINSSASSGRARRRARRRARMALRAGSATSASLQSKAAGVDAGVLSLASSRASYTPSSSDVSTHFDSGGGYCYLRMFRRQHHEALRAYGPSPVLSDLLQVPVEWFDTREALATLRVTRTSTGVYHVGRVGVPLLETLRVLDHAALGSVVLPAYIRHVKLSLDLVGKISLSDRLGAPVHNALEFPEWLCSAAGHQGDSFPLAKVQLLSKAAALRSPRDKIEGKMLEALGDAVLSTSVALRCVQLGLSAEKYQTARSEVTTNVSLSRIFVEKVPVRFVSFPSGVSPGTGKAGAYALEAIIGAIYQVYGQTAVTHFCEVLGIFDLHSW